MIEAHSPATNTDNQFESSAETSTPAYPAVPPSPMRTSTKRSASAVSEDHPPQPAPQRKRAKILPVIAESSGPSQNQVRKAKVTTRATRGVKKTVRPRRKPAVAAAAQARFSPSESGAGISRSAAERSGKQTNKLGLASSSTSRAPTTNTGDVRSRAAHAHMTRSQTRSLSHASTSSASSSTASRSGGANLGNPCDADTGRQVPPWDDSKSTGNNEGRGHLATKRSRLNEPVSSAISCWDWGSFALRTGPATVEAFTLRVLLLRVSSPTLVSICASHSIHLRSLDMLIHGKITIKFADLLASRMPRCLPRNLRSRWSFTLSPTHGWRLAEQGSRNGLGAAR